jgi:predicted permease
MNATPNESQPTHQAQASHLGAWFASIIEDLRHAARALRKSPSFTAVAVLTLALGIGANTAIFSVLDPLLLRKLPVSHPEELVSISSAGAVTAEGFASIELFRRYRDYNHVFVGVLAFEAQDHSLKHDERVSEAHGEIVSANYFSVLGVLPFKGRLINAEDGQVPRRAKVLVLSFAYWQREFASDSSVVGKTVLLDKEPYTIIGITPRAFWGVEVGTSPDVYFPMPDGIDPRDQYQAWIPFVMARLKPGVSIRQAQADLQPLFEEGVKFLGTQGLIEIERQEMMSRLVITPAARGRSEVAQRFSLPGRILMTVVGLVLLIACANVANLLFARGMARKREMTVRLALGAGRWRVARQLLIESALLATLGAIAGVMASVWGSNTLLASLSTSRFPVALNAGLGLRTFIFASAALAITILLCGLAPALAATRLNLAFDLKSNTTAPGHSSSRSPLARILVILQVTLSVMLLTGAGLLLRSLVNLETFNAGFDRDRVLAISTDDRTERTDEERAAFFSELVPRLRSLPGVRSVSFSSFTPMNGLRMHVNIAVDGYILHASEYADEQFMSVSPGYFETMGIPQLAGRDFTARDQIERHKPERLVAIINRSMARRFFGDKSPVGKQFTLVESHWPVEIVGVVADSKFNDLREKPNDFFYFPTRVGFVLEVRAGGDAKALAGPIRDVAHSIDGGIQINAIRTVREEVDESIHDDRVIAAVCGVFSLLALALASVGLYGVLSFNVARRTGEIGIRMALGAHPRDIVRLVVREGMILALVGVAAGVAGALALTRFIASMLFHVQPVDTLTLVGVALLLTATALLACYIPARRAMRVDPKVALRYE